MIKENEHSKLGKQTTPAGGIQRPFKLVIRVSIQSIKQNLADEIHQPGNQFRNLFN